MARPRRPAPAHFLMARTLVLAGSVALVTLLAFLTLSVLIEHGVTPLVVLSIALLVVLGFGVLGALTSPDDE